MWTCGGQVEYLSPVDKRTETDDHRRKPKRAIEVEEEVPLAEVKKKQKNKIETKLSWSVLNFIHGAIEHEAVKPKTKIKKDPNWINRVYF